MSDDITSAERATIRAAILVLTAQRGPDKSCCPSEVARRLNPNDWRSRMEAVRTVATALQRAGQIRITQRGQDVDATSAPGPVRLKAVETNARRRSTPIP